MRERRRRLIVTFVLLWSVITGVGIGILNALPIPPPQGVSDLSQGQSQLIRLLSELAWPIMVGVLLTLTFSIFVNRYAPSDIEPTAEALRGHRGIQIAWVAVTLALVLGLAGLGTVSLANDARVNTPDPQTNAPPLEVQVIAQQWLFTYRYPSFGGFESAQLVVPTGRRIDFHVTSLDVIHSWWFYAPGLKADAVPGADNVIETEMTQTGTYRITCSELCGLWHSGMAQDNAQIVSPSQFQAWAQEQLQLDAPVMKYLPPYSHTYVPQPGAYGT